MAATGANALTTALAAAAAAAAAVVDVDLLVDRFDTPDDSRARCVSAIDEPALPTADGRRVPSDDDGGGDRDDARGIVIAMVDELPARVDAM